MNTKWIKTLLWVASLYDLILGVFSLLFFKTFYAWLSIELPNHDGYVQFPAALVAIFGIGFAMAARAPERNVNIIILGALLKLAYSATVLGHFFLGSIPILWVPFAWIDLVFLVLFLAALKTLNRPAAAA